MKYMIISGNGRVKLVKGEEVCCYSAVSKANTPYRNLSHRDGRRIKWMDTM